MCKVIETRYRKKKFLADKKYENEFVKKCNNCKSLHSENQMRFEVEGNLSEKLPRSLVLPDFYCQLVTTS